MTASRTVLLSVPLLALAMIVRGVRDDEGPVADRAAPLADSVAEFGSVQDERGWSYGYWDRTRDADRRYDPASDFRPFEHYGNDPRNGLGSHDEFTTGPLWYLEDGRYYTSLWAEGGHANSGVALGEYAAAEQWAVRRWTSRTAGIVTISGQAGKVMPWGANWGGECRGLIMVDGEVVLSTVLDEQEQDYDVVVRIREGSVVDFLIAPSPSIGVVKFTATIRPRSTDIER
ncbi:MAG TPA: hypothetical protein DCQ98_04265 [Planctomycetaceae bacterium]|nr:hypothetical protein [Planctomycetaceae bacterium]HRE99682.1 hypothetical protein [Pirellulaceae bacterium]